jgi:hypothetical protein
MQEVLGVLVFNDCNIFGRGTSPLPNGEVGVPPPLFAATAGLVLAQVVDPATADSIARMIPGVIP